MSHIPATEVTRKRIAKWIESAKPVSPVSTWTERRLAIDIGGHTYIVTNGQIFQCAHCGTFDPEWSATEVLTFFKDNFDTKPYEIDVVCTVAGVNNV